MFSPIPSAAFYFHHVISATPSISINVFDAGSAARRPAADALACRLPLLSTWHTDLKRRALATAVRFIDSMPFRSSRSYLI